MGLTAKSSGEFKPCEAGTHLGICVSVFDLGTQRSEYMGEEQIKHQIIIGWEIPEQKMDDGQPYVVSKFYTLSLHEKANLRKDLEGWRGRPFTEAELEGFDVDKLLGHPCMLSVTVNAKGKNVVSSVSKVMKGLTVPEQHNKNKLFILDDYSREAWEAVPEGIQKIIAKSDEYNEMEAAGRFGPAPVQEGDPDDDVPF